MDVNIIDYGFNMKFLYSVFITLYVGFMAYVRCLVWRISNKDIIILYVVRVKMKFLSLYLSNVCIQITNPYLSKSYIDMGYFQIYLEGISKDISII